MVRSIFIKCIAIRVIASFVRTAHGSSSNAAEWRAMRPRHALAWTFRDFRRQATVALAFVGACAGCMQDTAFTTPGAGASVTRPRVATCDGSSFVNRIYVLPTAVAKPLSQPQQKDLSDAYCNASVTFRRLLDNVDFVFVDATNCSTTGDPATCAGISGGQALGASCGQRNQWGYTQSGIPASLWAMGQSAIKYPAYESYILDKLVPWTDSGDYLKYGSPSDPNNANTYWMTILAALAHEVGHVRWYEATVRAGWGQPYDFKRLTDCKFFSGWQYNTTNPSAIKKLQPKGRWRTFGGTTNESTNSHVLPPDWTQFQPGVNDDATLNDLLAQLLAGNQPWASFFASEAPDEDFVETFKFVALIDAGLTSLPLTIPTSKGQQNIDIPATYLAGNNTYLTNKVQCIRRWT